MGHADPVGGTNPQAPPRVIPFGKYLLLDRIAVGGMAEVYTAKSFGIEGFEKIIAIKRILPTMAEDSDFISMFIDEAKIAGHLTHANVVPIFELGKIGESHYIAMEYVWGKDLLQIMNRFRRMRRHMPPVMAAWISSKMLEGLDYAHRKRDRHGRPMGIIHRDVSPQNCLVSYEGQVKLIDFGIAKAASRNTKTQAGVLKGKFGYMSPEQVRGNAVDHRSDIFAASTCLHEMLTGERLFTGESDFSTLEKVRNADVVPPSITVPDMPQELEDILMKGMAREPDERWQTAGEMQEALQRFIALQRPPFGTSKLNTWMRTAFAPEITKEKGRLDSFSKIGHPGGGAVQPAAPQAAIPPSPVNGNRAPMQAATLDDFADMSALGDDGDDMNGESTMISASPFEAAEEAAARAAQGGGFDEIAEQATQIFFNADELEELPDDKPAAPAGSLSVPAPQAARMPPPRPIGAPASLPPPAPLPPAPNAPNAKATLRLDGAMLPQAPPGGPHQQGMPQQGMPQPGMPQPGGPQQGGPQPSGQDMFAPAPPAPAYPSQRNMQTMEVERPGQMRPPQGSKKNGLGKLLAIFGAVTFLVVVPLIIGGIYLFVSEDLGTVSVHVRPELDDVQVFVDGVQRGRGEPPLMIANVPEGTHTIEVRAQGYESRSRAVPVSAGSAVMLDIELEREALAVAAPPAAPTPPPAPAPEPEPEAEAEAEEPEETPVAEEPEPEARAEVERPRERRTPRRERAPRRAARTESNTFLAIQTLPWARVFIDGRDTRKNTPVRRLPVSPGRHTLGLRTNDGQMHTFQIEAVEGQTTRFSRQLGP